MASPAPTQAKPISAAGTVPTSSATPIPSATSAPPPRMTLTGPAAGPARRRRSGRRPSSAKRPCTPSHPRRLSPPARRAGRRRPSRPRLPRPAGRRKRGPPLPARGPTGSANVGPSSPPSAAIVSRDRAATTASIASASPVTSRCGTGGTPRPAIQLAPKRVNESRRELPWNDAMIS